MPNWVKNKVRAINREDAQRLIEMLVTNDSDDKSKITNFNGIIPMPNELRSGPSDENRRKYGYESWYEFAIYKWGTKWDRLSVKVNGNRVIEFESAWSIPVGVYEKISDDIPIVVAYADEDIGNNYGVVTFDHGESTEVPVSGTPEQVANAIWKYEYIPEDDPEGLCRDFYSEDVCDEVDKIIYG